MLGESAGKVLGQKRIHCRISALQKFDYHYNDLEKEHLLSLSTFSCPIPIEGLHLMKYSLFPIKGESYREKLQLRHAVNLHKVRRNNFVFCQGAYCFYHVVMTAQL